jgi:iron(II)-dependent oxidoreductase
VIDVESCASVANQLALTRAATLALVEPLDDDVMHRPLDPIMSPLVWDLAHIAAYEDLWAVHRLGGEPLLHEDLAATYDAFETPRALRSEIELLDRSQALEYLRAVRARTLDVLERVGPSRLHELVRFHELQHTETMRQALFLGRQPGGRPDALPASEGALEWVEFDAGEFQMGSAGRRFAYDNERPDHGVRTAAFAMQRFPVTNAQWLGFMNEGGYHEPRWWSPIGWAWKERYAVDCPLGWGDAPPNEPVQHISWFEADAFSRSCEARLPTEPEWERAAAIDGLLDGVGAVWEWTASEFVAYPGFRADPYPEYSEVFFDRGYRVLRGGSWATAKELTTPTFRNWDLPERRQIFSGLRLAKD